MNPQLMAGMMMAVLMATAMATGADPLGTLPALVNEGRASVSLRYRFEGVQQDNALEHASASTLRTRLTLESGSAGESGAAGGLTALLEADDVTVVGADRYDATRVDDRYFGTHSVIADPVGTEINQAWLGYGFSPALGITAGRQRINHAGQRFVGGVAWRQNEQTFDAFSVNYGEHGISVDYGYLWRVNRIFAGSGSSSQPTGFDSDSHILMVAMPLAGGKLSGFLYALDFREAKGLSSVTYGVGYDSVLDPFTVSASIATQSDYGDNSLSYDALFLSLEGRVKLRSATLIGGYELLGSDDGRVGFVTPLATLHKFQGWADQFLLTPANGVEDVYLGVVGDAGPVTLTAYYHQFSADAGNANYGTEVNLMASWPLGTHVSLELKYADYRADTLGVDTEKFWFTVVANISL